MHRLRDFYQTLWLNAVNEDRYKNYESYQEWQERTGYNETDDDAGKYGDVPADWYDEEIKESTK